MNLCVYALCLQGNFQINPIKFNNRYNVSKFSVKAVYMHVKRNMIQCYAYRWNKSYVGPVIMSQQNLIQL